MDKIISKLKTQRNSNVANSTKDAFTTLASGNLIDTLINVTSGAARTLRYQRVISLIDEVRLHTQKAEDYLDTIITESDHELHEITLGVILKAMDEFNEVKRHLLAKIMIYYIKNGTFDDFHETLFNNISTFTSFDFENIIVINDNILTGGIKKHPQLGPYMYHAKDKDFSILNTILKLSGANILQEYNGTASTFAPGTPSEFREGILFFVIEEKFKLLVEYINEATVKINKD